MASLSKILYYTCYEAAHTWDPSCSRASLEVLIIGFINGFKIYAIVYLLSAIVTKKKFSKKNLLKILSDNVRSACFLSINAGTFMSAHCFVRAVLKHINFISAAYIPGFIASFLAVQVERKSRHSLLAIYVTNVASECIWNILVSRGYVTPLPYGNVLLFSLTMMLFGYHFKKTEEFSPLVQSVMKLVLGKNELAENQVATAQKKFCSDNLSVFDKNPRNVLCPHTKTCWRNAMEVFIKSFFKGFLLQAAINGVTSIPRIFLKPAGLKKLCNMSCLRMALFFSWFCTSFQGICCFTRRMTGNDSPSNGAIAGAVAGLGLVFNPSTSLALYTFWKAIEGLVERQQIAGRLPTIPCGAELLYGLSTAFLFHLAIMENFNLKPSYWRFLLKLTDDRIGECNRLLLKPYGLESGRNQVWPKYDINFLSEDFKKQHADKLQLL